MTGFAEGFANGYGLMDATLQHQHENKLKQQLIDKEEAHHADTVAREERRDKQHASEFTTTSGLQKAQQESQSKYQDSMAGVAKQNADSQEQSRKDTAEYQRGSLGIQSMNAASNAASDRAAIAAHRTEQSINEAKLKSLQNAEKYDDAIKYFKINHKDQDGGFINMPETPEQMNEFVTHAKNAGIDINSMMNTHAYAQHLSNTANLLNDFHPNGKPTDMVMTADQAPDQFKSVNHILEQEINRLTGKKQEITAIHSHIGHPEFKGDDGVFYTFSTRDKDWKPQQITNPDGSPMTHRGSELTGAVINNAKIFEALHGSGFKQAWDNLRPELSSKDKPDYEKVKSTEYDVNGNPIVNELLVNKKTLEVNNPADNYKKQLISTELNKLNETKSPAATANPSIISPQVQNIINAQPTQPVNGLQTAPPLSRDQAVAKQNQMYTENAKNRKGGLRSLFLTPEEIAKQDSINK